MTIPTFSQIKALVAAIRRKVQDDRAIGIRATGRWTGERLKSDGLETYWIEQCDSPLAMRIALQEPSPESAIKVLITPLADQDLGDDVLVRLTKRRLFVIDSWQIVKSQFQARSVDPRITQYPWMAERLLDVVPADGYPPVAGGFLDAETVWPILLSREIGMCVERPDLLAILRWSIENDDVARFRCSSEAFRKAAVEWLVQLAGPTAEAVLDCVLTNERPDALPIGLAAGVIYSQQAAGKLDKAAGRLEVRFLGGRALEEPLIQRWHAAATEVVSLQLTDPKVKRLQLHRADEILREVQADTFAYLNATSPLGFDQRLARFGSVLTNVIQSSSITSLEPLVESHEAVIRHEQARPEPRRMQRLEMALRLVRWLARSGEKGEPAPASFAEAAQRFLAEGSFVDWARYTLQSDEPVRELAEAYTRLWDRVTEVRQQQNRRFAELLCGWTAAGSTGRDVIPVEQMLDEIVAPLAAAGPVLLVVIDGMSAAVSRELVSDITRQDWIALCEAGRPANRPGLATIPSVTEVSRTSLFCGKLKQGAANDEVTGFAEHPALLTHCRSGSPPVLFHKVALQDAEDVSLAAGVRKEIGSSHRRIVGVVINAVDDHLLKGQQIDIRWSREQIKALSTLLHEGKAAGRVVILVSDHGHILDYGTQMGSCEASERWRTAEGQPADGEFLVEGHRVVLGDGHRLIAPWTERLRYSKGSRNGYHGGLTPQEMVIPISVLAASQNLPRGWVEAPVDTPDWWEQPDQEHPVEETPEKIKPIQKKDKGLLFDIHGEEEVEKPQPESRPEIKAEQQDPAAAWLKALLASPLLEDQKKLAGRAVPPDPLLAQLLSALNSRGGKITSTALAKSLQIPPFRLRGLLAVVQRMLNIDGFAVLARDEASDTIELNRELLLKQFDLI